MKQNICLFGSSKQNATQNSQSVYEIMNIKMPATIFSYQNIQNLIFCFRTLFDGLFSEGTRKMWL